MIRASPFNAHPKPGDPSISIYMTYVFVKCDQITGFILVPPLVKGYSPAAELPGEAGRTFSSHLF